MIYTGVQLSFPFYTFHLNLLLGYFKTHKVIFKMFSFLFETRDCLKRIYFMFQTDAVLGMNE